MQQLNADCLDALREVGNIGAGNAMTALATMVDHRVDMSVPQVGVVSLGEFTQMAGGPEASAVGVYMPVTGDAPGHVAFLLSEESACRLTDELLGRELGTTTDLGEIERSALTEIGNIMASSYLIAICELTGLNLYSSPPALAVDMTAAILSTIAAAFASLDDQALTVTTRIREGLGKVDGFFIFVPESGSLSAILRALQMEG
jgi:chemotaxis protein CheC